MTPEAIRTARLSAGFTQSQAADLVHVTLRAPQQWEAGTRDVPLNVWDPVTIKFPQGSVKTRDN